MRNLYLISHSQLGSHTIEVKASKFADWKRLLSIHLDGAFLTTRAVLQRMYKQGTGGSIIYMGSVHSKEASLLKAPYVTAKHGLIGLTKVLAAEWASHNVRVVCLDPGYIRAGLGIKGQTRGAFSAEDIERRTPMGRLGTPADIGNVVALFCSDKARWITGQVIYADGGASLMNPEVPPETQIG